MLTTYAEPEAYRTRQENFERYMNEKYQEEREYDFDNAKGDYLVKDNAYAVAEFLSELYSVTTDIADTEKTLVHIRVALNQLRATLCERE